MAPTYTKSRTYEIYPNKQMKAVLDANCNYRRFCWNKALEIWNQLYEAHSIFDKVDYVMFMPKQSKRDGKWHAKAQEHRLNPSPSWRRVRDIMVENKEDWQFGFSAHLLQLAVQDLGKAWQNFFDKSQSGWGKPRFHFKREPRQGFKSDQAAFTTNGRLRLEKPQGLKEKWTPLKLSEKPLSYPTGVMSFYRENGHYYVAVPYKIPTNKFKSLPQTGRYTGVDANVGHFNYLGGTKLVLPRGRKQGSAELRHLARSYSKIKFYQRSLAKKRVVNGRIKGTQSRNYLETRIKLQQAYQTCSNIQHDLMHKFTAQLVKNYDTIDIEDLGVKKMMMTHVASKGMHRSMFSLFRQLLAYKCQYYGRELIIADKFYPSTQRCAMCGQVKKGDDRITLKGNEKHHTRHNEFICYNKHCPNYMKKIDRDQNAMLNLTLLAKHPELNKAL